MIKDSVKFTNLMSHDDEPGWKQDRYPFDGSIDLTIDKMKPGFLVKFNSDRTAVEPAVAADDAALEGVIVDLPDPTDVLPDSGDALPSVLVVLQGSFDENQIHYADAAAALDAVPPTAPTALSAAALARLRAMGIFLEPAVKATPTPPS